MLKTLESPLDCKKIKPVNLKENQPWICIGRTAAEAETPRAHSLEKTLMLGKIEGKRRGGWQRMRWLDSITNLVDMNLSKLREIVKDREAWHAMVLGVTKSRMWQRLNNNITYMWNLKYDTNEPMYQTETHRPREQTCGFQV